MCKEFKALSSPEFLAGYSLKLVAPLPRLHGGFRGAVLGLGLLWLLLHLVEEESVCVGEFRLGFDLSLSLSHSLSLCL